MTVSELYDLPQEWMLAPPPAAVSPPTEPRQTTLPFLELSWELFEQLCAEVARVVDGYYDVRLYGERGQKQYGIDLYAVSERRSSVYQVRRVRELTAAELENAVVNYGEQGQRLSAERFVLCTACDANNTHTIDMLKLLRERYAHIVLELYDRQRLSVLLRDYPKVVEAFFGQHWKQSFCVTGNVAPSLDRRALVSGPTRALNLDQMVSEAEQLMGADPWSASQKFSAIAQALRPRYPLQAMEYAQRAAAAMAAAQRWEPAFDSWLHIAMEELWDRSSPRLSGRISTALVSLVERVDDVRRARWTLLRAWQAWHEKPQALRDLASGFDELYSRGDWLATRAGVLFAEASIADRETGEVANRANALSTLSTPAATPEQLRRRIALADISGVNAWEELYREAVILRRMSTADAAYVALRAGLRFAWDERFKEAEAAYRSAVVLASECDLDLDVENALWSLVGVYAKAQRWDHELHETNQLALSVRGTRSYVPHDPRAGERTLRAMIDEGSRPEAHMWLRHQLWQALVTGSFLAEREAYKNLGLLYEQVGSVAPAVKAYILADEPVFARRAASRLEDWKEVSLRAMSSQSWSQRCAFRALAGGGDLVPDDIAESLVEPIRSALGRNDDTGQAAAEAAGALAFQLSAESASLVLDAFVPLMPRQRDHYHRTDSGALIFLAAIYEMYPSLRATCAASISEMAVGSGLDPELLAAVHQCAHSPGALIPPLKAKADEGEQVPLVLLAALDVDDDRVLRRESKRLNAILARETGHPRSAWGMGSNLTLSRTFVERLTTEERARYGQKLIDIALDEHDMIANRATALLAIAALAEMLPTETRVRLMSRILQLAQGVRLSEIDEMQNATLHPLSRFRIDFGNAETGREAAIIAAAHLASTFEECGNVGDVAFQFLASGIALPSVARVLVILNDKQWLTDPVELARFPHPQIRSAAAMIWSSNPSPSEVGRTLAMDTHQVVRATLANRLPTIALQDARLAADLRTILVNDRSGYVRWKARITE